MRPFGLAHTDIVFEVFPSARPRHVLDRRGEELAVLEARERLHRTVVIRLVRQRAAYLVGILGGSLSLAEVEGFRVRGLGGVRGSVGRVGRDVVALRRAKDGNTGWVAVLDTHGAGPRIVVRSPR